MITVSVELKETSQPILMPAINTYTKGPFFCVYTVDKKVVKFPLDNIWRVMEDYSADGIT